MLHLLIEGNSELKNKSFKIPKSYFKIIRGETAKDKTLLISNTSMDYLLKFVK